MSRSCIGFHLIIVLAIILLSQSQAAPELAKAGAGLKELREGIDTGWRRSGGGGKGGASREPHRSMGTGWRVC